MIVSSLKFDSIISRILKPTPLFSYNRYKNDSLCLDTLYVTASSCERYILTCKGSEYLQDVCKTFSGFYVTASGCERYILTCERSEYLQKVCKTFSGIYVTASVCERYILTCEHSEYLQEVCKTFWASMRLLVAASVVL